eukprot:271200-Pyramimonas_sp.AAC.1
MPLTVAPCPTDGNAPVAQSRAARCRPAPFCKARTLAFLPCMDFRRPFCTALVADDPAKSCPRYRMCLLPEIFSSLAYFWKW